jgi:hypothetical protein
MESNIVKTIDIRNALTNSLEHTHYLHTDKGNERNQLKNFQHLYESDHDCSIIKMYSGNHRILSKYTDIRYWHSLQFNSGLDITMFVLRWA